MQQVFAFNELAIAVRHWFEIGPDDDEHGARLEIRRIARHPHRGSESAPQVLELRRRITKASLMVPVGEREIVREERAAGLFGIGDIRRGDVLRDFGQPFLARRGVASARGVRARTC